jgi:hypothetical protein
MVSFTDDHKVTVATTNRTTFEWFDADGRIKEINVTKLTDTELFALRNSIKTWYLDQMGVIDDEINNWHTIYCSVCGAEDLAFRGRPFVTWGLRGGYTLCPRHTRAFDRYGTPEAKLLAEAKAEDAEIKELFG